MAWSRYATTVYWILFTGAFLAVAVWETFRPKRILDWPTGRRWGSHAMLFAVSTLIQAAVLRASPVVLAMTMEHSRFGILNRPWIPFLVRCALAILLLDVTLYATHRAFHSFPILWRIHEVHHSDPDYDVSTAGRFHPLETTLNQAAQLAVVALFAPPPIAVLAAVFIAEVQNLFVHANASLPGPVEKLLRGVTITPDLHRIHHSEDVRDQLRNFGQTFCWWDRAFGSFLAGPAGEDDGRKTGIKELKSSASLNLGFMLTEPFRSRTSPATVSRDGEF